LIALSPATVLSSAPLGDPKCTNLEVLNGECPDVTNQGDQLEVGWTQTTPGESHQDEGGGGWYRPPESPPAQNPDPVIPWMQTEDGRMQYTCEGGSLCLTDSSTDERAPDEEDETVIPEFTIHDVAIFAPEPPALDTEPAGVGIVGMPVNFVVPATAHTVTGELFDFPLRVRFSPVSYDFAYGDGSTRHATTGGTTWPELGQPQFTATATSHAYGERGTYTTTVDVNYAASIDLGGGFFDIPGTLTLTTPAATTEILELHTALVENTCIEDPTGPGC